MNIKSILISTAVAAGVCIGLVALTHLLYLGVDAQQHNERHGLVSFLAIALPGIWISLLLTLWSQKRLPKSSLWIGWGSAALFGIFLPAPGIIISHWADMLIFWYLGGALVAGGLYGSTLTPKEKEKEPETKEAP